MKTVSQYLPLFLFQMTMSLLAKPTAIRVQHCEAAVATTGLDIGHTRSATPASTSACMKQQRMQRLALNTPIFC